jgi:hypothetical protein
MKTKLTIQNFDRIAASFQASDWMVLETETREAEYAVQLQRRDKRSKARVVIHREAIREKVYGKSEYSTRAETLRNGLRDGSVTADFIRKPENLVQHILMMIS